MVADPITLTAILAGIAYVSGKVRIIRASGFAGWRQIVDEISAGIFKTWLPARAKPYGDLILRVAKEQGVDPFILFAIGDRETNWGAASSYRNQTGDWTPRCRSQDWVNKNPGLYKVVGTCKDGSLSVMPGDNLGWGRGIAQIDWESQRPWPQQNNWRDDYINLTKGAKLLQGHLVYFAAIPLPGDISVTGDTAARLRVAPGKYPDPRPLKGQALIAAALSAYNAGMGNARAAVAAGRPADYLTAPGMGNPTPGDYATDTLKRANVLASNFDKNGGKAV